MALLSRAEIFAKIGSFDDFTWKFEPALLLRGNLFPKIKQFCWCDLKFWTAPTIFPKKAVLLIWFGNLNCSYYHQLKFSQKYPRFNEVTRIFELPLLSRVSVFWLRNLHCPIIKIAEVFGLVRQFWWSHLEIQTILVITR